jgi:formamidopyrimidine-DNA glycosylase
MPELPEVERARRLIERVARGRRITKVVCARDTIVFDGVSGLRVRRVLTGRTVLGVARRGKHLWLELEQRPWPCFHLGMTGAFHTPGVTPLKLASSPAVEDVSWPPRFTKLRLVLDDGGELAMTNKRRLGRIRLRNDPPAETPISRLGFDPLLDLPSAARFLELRKADELSTGEVRRLRVKLKDVVATAVRVDADKSRFPRHWLFHRRWKRDPTATTLGGDRIEHVTIGGRTTAWVPAIQV